MTTPLDRIRQLMALALNEASSAAEARTAALTAIRLIDEGFEVVEKKKGPASVQWKRVETDSKKETDWERQEREMSELLRDAKQWVRFRGTLVTRCKNCVNLIYPGDWAYHRAGTGSLHENCFHFLYGG